MLAAVQKKKFMKVVMEDKENKMLGIVIMVKE